MDERRRAKRLKKEFEVVITIVSGAKDIPKEKIIYNLSVDISAYGAKVRANIFLPVNTLLRIGFNLEELHQNLETMGKVKWITILYDDEAYEAGVEFVNTPNEAISKIEEYVNWKINQYTLKSESVSI
ncbi:MAG TPA: PilZ domain-containing protein [Smithella sp.]|nr:PilZ domain-containing protein [Smithella sp.]